MSLLRKTRNVLGGFILSESVEIDAAVERVFAHWNRYEDFPRFMVSVQRTKRIDEQRTIWDVDFAGHQIVWEARVVERVAPKRVRWESTWGATHWGEARFEALSDTRTRLTVEIEYRPRGLLEQLGARLCLADRHVRADLERYAHFVENLPSGEAGASRNGRAPGSKRARRADRARVARERW